MGRMGLMGLMRDSHLSWNAMLAVVAGVSYGVAEVIEFVGRKFVRTR